MDIKIISKRSGSQPRSNSVNEYRNIIDDLTLQIHKLKDELKRYKQIGPSVLRADELFEIRIHGLSNRKKLELEASLREFANGLADSSNSHSSSSSQKKSAKHAKRNHFFSRSCPGSSHQSSPSGCNAPPADSAYASMTTGTNASRAQPGRSSFGPQTKIQRKALDCLSDTPEGLHPRSVAMSNKERKKLVVRRLEQLFTGKATSRHGSQPRAVPAPSFGGTPLAAVSTDGTTQMSQQTRTSNLTAAEPAREARIMPLEQQNVEPGKESRLWHDELTSNSSGGHSETTNGNKNNNGSTPPEQRPTRPKDLDPDRIQDPSENMEYIRHLGFEAPGMSAGEALSQNAHPNAGGWVYLNVLYNMAQLHLLSVTPNFVRYAVMEFSTKLQVSQDGRKIRWSGGSKGIKLSHVDSEEYSERNSVTEDASNSGSAGQRKRQKSGVSAAVGTNRGSLRTDSYHYTPLFAQQEPLDAQTQPAADGRYSSLRLLEDDEVDQVQWEGIACAASKSRKRYHDGVIIYYKGAPFYADLLGDRGSPDGGRSDGEVAYGQAATERVVSHVPAEGRERIG